MRENNLRTLWRDGGSALNGWLSIPDSFSAETMAHQGWDTLTVDMQHGPVGYDNALTMLQALSSSEVTPIARVPWNEPGIIGKVLDAGVAVIRVLGHRLRGAEARPGPMDTRAHVPILCFRLRLRLRLR